MKGRFHNGAGAGCALLLLTACHSSGTADLSPTAAHTPESSRADEAPPGDDPAASPAGPGSSAAPDSSDLGEAARPGTDPPTPPSTGDTEGNVPLAPSRRFPPVPGRTLRAIAPAQICATLGELLPAAAGLRVDDPKLRATLAGSDGNAIELSFRYLGPTAQTTRLGSGTERRQLGLELSARDTCNLLYVMWRIDPESELVVQVKSNGDQSTHAECENRGYHRLRPTISAPVPTLTPGAEHQLHAEIAGETLSVHVDGSLVWSGPLDDDALALHGRSGLRSDNARFELLELLADERAGALATCPPRP